MHAWLPFALPSNDRPKTAPPLNYKPHHHDAPALQHCYSTSIHQQSHAQHWIPRSSARLLDANYSSSSILSLVLHLKPFFCPRILRKKYIPRHIPQHLLPFPAAAYPRLSAAALAATARASSLLPSPTPSTDGTVALSHLQGLKLILACT